MSYDALKDSKGIGTLNTIFSKGDPKVAIPTEISLD